MPSDRSHTVHWVGSIDRSSIRTKKTPSLGGSTHPWLTSSRKQTHRETWTWPPRHKLMQFHQFHLRFRAIPNSCLRNEFGLSQTMHHRKITSATPDSPVIRGASVDVRLNSCQSLSRRHLQVQPTPTCVSATEVFEDAGRGHQTHLAIHPYDLRLDGTNRSSSSAEVSMPCAVIALMTPAVLNKNSKNQPAAVGTSAAHASTPVHV